MKKLIVLPLTIITLIILSAVTIMAADEVNLHADFENYNEGSVYLSELTAGVKSSIFVEKNGSNKVLRLAHKSDDGSSTECMISKYTTNIKSEAIFTFDIQNRNPETGLTNVQLRSNDGNSPNNSTNLINLATIKNNVISYLPGIASCAEALEEGQMSKILVVLNPQSGDIKIYNNSCLKCSTNIYDYNSGSLKAFDWSKTILRFQNYVAETPSDASEPYVTDIIFDNIRIAQGTGDVIASSARLYYGDSLTMVNEVKNGSIKAEVSLLNKGSASSMVKTFIAYKSDGVLKNLYPLDCTIAPYSSTYISDTINISDSQPDDTLEVIVMDPQSLKPYLTTDVMYIRNIIETPIEEELEYLYNAKQAPHPRLIATKDDFDRVRNYVKTDITAEEWADAITDKADKMVEADITSYSSPYYLAYSISSTNDILAMSRKVLDMMQTLGFAHQLTNKDTSVYSEKAAEVLFYVSLFKDWYPTHFLDTAEMMAAYAIGYDWMYHAFDEATRQMIESTVLKKGLLVAQNAYNGTGGDTNSGWWKNVDYNWNTVCNGGIAITCAAFADVYPDIAFELSAKAVNYMKIALEPFAPHGGYSEGCTYAIYSMEYFSRCIPTLKNTYGTDFGMTKHPGLSGVGDFLIQADGPTGTNNYHDAGSSHINTFVMSYLGNEYNKPYYSGARVCSISNYGFSVTPFDLIWYDSSANSSMFSGIPTDGYFAEAEFISMRSDFGGDALFLSAHGGEASVSHSHIDGGTFVLDMNGVRFASDIGADGYSKDGYFGTRRYEYYRARAEGHNTLVINPDESPGQSISCNLPFEKVDFEGSNPFAILDMTDAYLPYGATSVKRGYMLCDNRQSVVIRDEVELIQESTVYWFMHTTADITVNGNKLTLTIGDESMEMEFVTNGQNTELSYGAAEPLPQSNSTVDNASNSAYKRIIFKATSNGSLNISVKFTPSSGEFSSVNNINSLSSWQ